MDDELKWYREEIEKRMIKGETKDFKMPKLANSHPNKGSIERKYSGGRKSPELILTPGKVATLIENNEGYQ